ncbi:MAG TPA: histidinol-phosphatase HisJ family protein [Bacteroidales bacterium]|nr:histidinol-phosphatase HisJ family protein [Bacteroidales bacterium]
MIDYHTHSLYSDGKNTYKELLDTAYKKNLSEIGFSDHLCLHYPDWAVKESQLLKLSDDIISLKNNSSSPVKVKFGFEVDYIDGKEDEIRKMLEKFPLDYAIGSVHYINNWNFDTIVDDYHSIDIDKFYNDYFLLIQKAAKSKLFDIIGHADLAKKFAFYPSFNLDAIYEETAKVFAESNAVVELNTSGKDKPCKEFYPSVDFLKQCFNHGVPVTLGSDSHHIPHLARYFNDAIQLLIEVGYTQIVSFTQRKPNYIPLV